jgi:hypothetical protein
MVEMIEKHEVSQGGNRVFWNQFDRLVWALEARGAEGEVADAIMQRLEQAEHEHDDMNARLMMEWVCGGRGRDPRAMRRAYVEARQRNGDEVLRKEQCH